MLSNNGIQLITKATTLLWIGWLLMLIALFLPVVNWPIPDPHMPSLLFLLLPVPNVNEAGEVATLTHVPIQGLITAFFLIVKTLEHASLSAMWGLLLIITIPMILALFAPLLLWVKSKKKNILLAICYGVGFLGPGMTVLLSVDSSLIGQGFYFWVVALFLLTMSRITLCFPQKVNND